MQAAESKHAAAVESLKEGWVAELKRQKEAWAAAEKARRDTWLADKTKQVKELTIKVRHSPPRQLVHTQYAISNTRHSCCIASHSAIVVCTSSRWESRTAHIAHLP